MSADTALACQACGLVLEPGATACRHCGTPVSGRAAALGYSPLPGGAPGGFTWEGVVARLRDALSGEYQILAELGRGGFASVLLARDLALNRRVALKVMSPSVLMGEGMLDRAQQEAVTHANLSHPNIVPVYGLRVVEDLFFIAMQYVPGRSLQQVIRAEYGAGRVLSLDVIRGILYMVGNALAYAHRRGVVHRDIKPANILLSGDGEAIVTDFGIAKVSENSSHTQTGTVVGTAQYMSPEQCYAARVTGASDQYALGIVAFELLTGAPPFSGNSFAVMQAQTMQPPPPPSRLRADCPPAMETAILRMLAKEPSDRFPSIPEALSALGTVPVSTFEADPVRAALMELAAVDEVASQVSGIMAPISPLIGRTPSVGDVRRDSGRGAASGPPSGPKATLPARVAVKLAKTSLEAGEETPLVATVLSSTGEALPNIPVQWRSSDSLIVSVDSARGVLVARGPGRADVVATAGDAVTAVQLEVTASRVVKVVLDGPDSLEIGERATFTARAVDARSGPLDVPLQWTSHPLTVATVDARGEVQPRSAGEASITVRTGEVTASRTVRVVPPRPAFVRVSLPLGELAVGERTSAQATVTDKLDAPARSAQVVWTSADPEVATVDAAGLVTAVDIGDTVLLARAGDAVGEVAVAVRSGVVTRVEVVGLDTPLPERKGRQLAARTLDRNGRARDVPVVWETTDLKVATITPTGALTARAPGETLVTVRCASIEQSLPLRVERVVPVSEQLSTVMGGTGRWLVGLGLLLAVGVGVVILTRRPPAVTTEPLVLPPPPLPPPQPAGGSVTGADSVPQLEPVEPSTVRVQLLLPRSLVVDESRMANVEVTGVAAGTLRRFASSDGRVATVDRDGRVTARAPGTVRISVVVDTITAVATLRVVTRDSVTAVPVRLALQPTEIELDVGGSTLIRASVSGAAAAEVEWSTDNPAVARVDRSGRVTAVGPGSTSVVARVGDVRERVILRVNDAAVVRVVVEGARSLRAGERVSLSARALTSSGAAAAVRITWASRSPAIATVEPNGSVHAISPGTAEIVASAGGVNGGVTVSVEPAVAEPPPTERVELSPDAGLALAQQCLAAIKGGRERILLDIAPSEARARLLDALSRNATVSGGVEGLSVDPAGRADFRVQARARNSFGRTETVQVSVSAIGRREGGSRWSLESCQIR